MYWKLEVTRKNATPLRALRTCLFWLFFNLFFLLGIHLRIPLCLSLQDICKNSIHHAFDTSSHYTTSLLHAFKHLTSILDQHEELKALRIKNRILDKKIQELQELAEENVALSALLSKTKSAPPYQALSRVIFSSSHTYMRSLLIEAQGETFSLGQAVATDEGLVGYISELHNDFSTVTLIHDMHSHIPVRVGQAEGVLTGSTSGDLIITMINQIDTVMPGMTVQTLSNGENIPSDIHVGVVESVADDTVYVTPSAQRRPMFVMVLPIIRKKL